jgi:hypothetical protein
VIQGFQFLLRVWGGSEKPTAADLLSRVFISPSDPVHVEEGPGSPRIRLLLIDAREFASTPEPSEAFASALRERLLAAAQWLMKQDPAGFQQLRDRGLNTDLFIGGWITDDQFDLDLPPEFLTACGRLGLTVSVCTND